MSVATIEHGGAQQGSVTLPLGHCHLLRQDWKKTPGPSRTTGPWVFVCLYSESGVRWLSTFLSCNAPTRGAALGAHRRGRTGPAETNYSSNGVPQCRYRVQNARYPQSTSFIVVRAWDSVERPYSAYHRVVRILRHTASPSPPTLR
ncbi:Hypothetical protein CGLY_16710 (plasmid) [Corynebacterium glyciniphilum AJ 3170]|uniref:Uncharacterized protein n=1 Tax=Corynebacterium glyciniphilum AJ 3170 TaxID=1404245 RepID=X5EEA1_9CORY|nr:Hypothetical protein CGLY_16710 [Corynebacterium glyciniphilum AJ 3170]